MSLPSAVQQTLRDVGRHYEAMQKQITKLTRDNLELSKKLKAGQVPVPAEPIPIVPGEVSCDWSAPATIWKDTEVKDDPGQSRLAENATEGNGSSAIVAAPSMDAQDSLAAQKLRHLRSDPFEDENADEPEEVPDSQKLRCSLTCISNCVMLRDSKIPFMKRITNAMLFQMLMPLAIGTNTIYLGFAADVRVRNASGRIHGLRPEEESALPGIVFTVWFTFELILKILADGKDFFLGEDQYWNVFDSLLVLESILSLSFSGAGLKLSFLRMFRVFRLVRVVRMVRTVNALAKLRTMIFAIINTFIDLCWAFLVIFLILFVFGMTFTTLVASYFDAVDMNNPQAVEEAVFCGSMFGSLGDSMISLWSAVSGGNDWMTYAEPLRNVSDFAFSIFIFYISFCTVGLFNVVTGVFVDGAVCCRTADEEIQNYFEDLRNTTDEIKNIFKESDKDGTGVLNLSEFKTLMRQPRAKAYFSGLNINPDEANLLFTILDEDQSDGILIDEFVHGTMRLKGAASKLDLVTLMYDFSRQSQRVEALFNMVEREMVEIKGRLTDKVSTSQASGDCDRELIPPAQAKIAQDGGLHAAGVPSELPAESVWDGGLQTAGVPSEPPLLPSALVLE